MEITKIVITGGPCAGKSTAMSWIQNAFTQKGYRVLFVPEYSDLAFLVKYHIISILETVKCLLMD